jgi:hypothetical protein
MSAAVATSSITPRRASRIELAADLSLADLAIWSGISVNKLYYHLREAHDRLPAYNFGRKWMVNKQEYVAWRARRFSNVAPDPAIVPPRRRRRKSRGQS